MTARLPTGAADPTSSAARYIARHGIEQYRREYAAGWQASARTGRTGATSAKWEDGTSSDAWDDGYLDRAAGRPRWHLTTCPNHDTCGEA